MSKNGKTAGPDGITNSLLKSMANVTWFTTFLADSFQTIINHPESVKDIPELFEFTLCCIPKDPNDPSKGNRPLAIQNSCLNIFHRILLNIIKRPVCMHLL
jgi:hypothetical protein